MPKVIVTVTEIELETESGVPIDGVEVKCSLCLHTEEAFGTSQRSVTAACMKLKETCPRAVGRNLNFYTDR